MDDKDEEKLEFGNKNSCELHRISVLHRLIPLVTQCWFKFNEPSDYEYIPCEFSKFCYCVNFMYFESYSISSNYDIALYFKNYDARFHLSNGRFLFRGIWDFYISNSTGTITFKHLLPTQNQLESVITATFYKINSIVDIRNSDIIPIIVSYCNLYHRY